MGNNLWKGLPNMSVGNGGAGENNSDSESSVDHNNSDSSDDLNFADDSDNNNGNNNDDVELVPAPVPGEVNFHPVSGSGRHGNENEQDDENGVVVADEGEEDHDDSDDDDDDNDDDDDENWMEEEEPIHNQDPPALFPRQPSSASSSESDSTSTLTDSPILVDPLPFQDLLPNPVPEARHPRQRAKIRVKRIALRKSVSFGRVRKPGFYESDGQSSSSTSSNYFYPSSGGLSSALAMLNRSEKRRSKSQSQAKTKKAPKGIFHTFRARHLSVFVEGEKDYENPNQIQWDKINAKQTKKKIQTIRRNPNHCPEDEYEEAFQDGFSGKFAENNDVDEEEEEEFWFQLRDSKLGRDPKEIFRIDFPLFFTSDACAPDYQEIHEDRMWCEVCELSFRLEQVELFVCHHRRHMALEHFSCPICMEGFCTLKLCCEHEVKVHGAQVCKNFTGKLEESQKRRVELQLRPSVDVNVNANKKQGEEQGQSQGQGQGQGQAPQADSKETDSGTLEAIKEEEELEIEKEILVVTLKDVEDEQVEEKSAIGTECESKMDVDVGSGSGIGTKSLADLGPSPGPSLGMDADSFSTSDFSSCSSSDYGDDDNDCIGMDDLEDIRIVPSTTLTLYEGPRVVDQVNCFDIQAEFGSLVRAGPVNVTEQVLTLEDKLVTTIKAEKNKKRPFAMRPRMRSGYRRPSNIFS